MRLPHREYTLALLIFLVGSGLAISAFFTMRSAEMGEVRAEFDHEAAVHFAALRKSIETNLLVLESFHSLYTAEQEHRPLEFQEFVGPFLQRLDGVRGLEWIPRVRHAERAAFEAEMDRNQIQGFEIRERNERDELRTASQRPEYFPVSQVEPLQNNKSVIGFDLGSDPTRLAALEMARDTGVAAATARIALVQETEANRYGFLVFMPIYSGNWPEDSIPNRRESLRGFILGVFQFPDLVERALSSIPSSDIDLALIDDSAQEEESLLYYRPSQSSRQSNASFAEVFTQAGDMVRVSTLEVGGRQWSIRCAPSATYVAAGLSPYPFWLLGIGIGFSAMLSAFLFLATHRARELADINVRLRTEVEERAKAVAEKETLEAHLGQAKKMEALGTLAGGVAHDFNNFLAAIAGYAELATHSVTEESQAHSDMTEILRISETAKNVIQEILAFSRPTQSVIKNVEAAALLREVIAIIRVSLPASIDIQEKIDDNCGAIHVDPTRMKQVLLNLCTNAYQAMDGKHGMLTIGLSSVELTSAAVERDFEAKAGKYSCFSISDTGCGIPTEILERIFDPYYTTKSERKGTGLGLSIVHGIVKDAGGIVNVTSVPDDGSDFRVLIPIAKPETEAESAPPKKNKTREANHRVLLVDDEPDVLKITSRMLKKIGYEVEAFENPVEGLQAFEAGSDKFDLVFLDATMPTMSGLQLAESIQKIRPVSILLASGNIDKNMIAAAKDKQIDHLLQKPFTLDDLRQLFGVASPE